MAGCAAIGIMRAWASVCLFIGIISSHGVIAGVLNDNCTTPDNFHGRCIALRDCPKLYTLLTRVAEHPTSANAPNVKGFLGASQCGMELEPRHPLVCCRFPKDPPPVSDHANIKLINRKNCGTHLPDRIFNGNETALLDFRWMALLGYRSEQDVATSFLCGGTLINERYVLTAAHCVAEKPLVSVRLGEHNTSTGIDCEKKGTIQVCADPPLDVGIEETVVHPQYTSGRLMNDVALIRLNNAVNINTGFVSTICLPVGPEQTRNLTSKNLTVAGWGLTEKGSESNVLMKVLLPVMSNEQCHALYKTKHNIDVDEAQICAGGSELGQDSCNGDSGGPLKMKGNSPRGKLVQYGIVSYGPLRCATPGVPGVYTRVGHYMKWILDQMRS